MDQCFLPYEQNIKKFAMVSILTDNSWIAVGAVTVNLKLEFSVFIFILMILVLNR